MKKQLPKLQLDELMPHLIGIWRAFSKIPGPMDHLQTREFRKVVSSLTTLHNGLQTGKDLLGKDYFKERDLLGAYLLYDWVVHYQQGVSLLNELPYVPKRVLDVCAGPGAFAFAALMHGSGEVYATDWNATALKLGGEVAGRYGFPLTFRQWNCLEEAIPVEGEFDLIILGHALEELFPSNQKGWREREHQFIKFLLSKLTKNGFLLLVDSSLIDSNVRILSLRDKLFQEGVPIQAPCVFKGLCPALQTKNSPCYAQREFEKPPLIKEIQRSAKINLSSLKMSYIIFRSPKSHSPELRDDQKLYRVISPPIESVHGDRYYLCGTDGKKILSSHLKEHPKESKAFEYLKRGELISIQDGLENGNAIDIIQGTKVKVEAALGKPIPEKEAEDV